MKIQKKFHVAATERFRLNTITSLDTADGRSLTSHEDKAALLLEGYKSRLGQTTQTQMHFNLADLVQFHDLQCLDDPFTMEELHSIIKFMPADKASGPDGFNGVFLKKCWHIIKNDFFQLCNNFYNGEVNIQPINSAFITLIQQTLQPQLMTTDQYLFAIVSPRLSLSCWATDFKNSIISLVHTNQYGFIKSRTIQDYLAWAFEYIYQCHHSKREIVILKLDFTKAFDTIEHKAITQMMESLGFSNRWINWTKNMLESATTSILLNGVPSRNIHRKRGDRQGDPLSFLSWQQIYSNV
jgi:hypothetical protein